MDINKFPQMNSVAAKLESGGNVPTDEMIEALGEVMTTPFTAFLANAYNVPPDLRALLVDKYDTVAERNIGMFLVCFSYFMFKLEDKLLAPTQDTFLANSDKFDNFLATAVLLTYVDK